MLIFCAHTMKAKCLVLALILIMSSLSVGCLDNARRSLHRLTDDRDDDRDRDTCYDDNRQEVDCEDEEERCYDENRNEVECEDDDREDDDREDETCYDDNRQEVDCDEDEGEDEDSDHR
jgi:hypothetical protein